VSRRPAAQKRAPTAGTHSRQVPRLKIRGAMPDAVDARVLGKQRPLTEPSLYPGRRYARTQELRPGDDSLLLVGNPRNFLLHRPA
jgi:hypothetical protein